MAEEHVRSFAVIVAGTDEEYQSSVLSGIMDAAKTEQVNASVFASFGGVLDNPLCDIGEYNIYNLINYSRFDGFILLTNTICPLEIRKKCEELGLVEKTEKRFSAKDLVRKALAIIVLIVAAVLVMIKINHAETFWQGFFYTFIVWLSITWFDALVLDCIWFCHSKRMRIPGTEDMKEYHDYLFHIKQSCIGTLLGIPSCAVVGLFVALAS